jgi:autotransporter strand-loop-strand O-heptosyltransferase
VIEFPIENKQPGIVAKMDAKEKLGFSKFRANVLNVGLWTRGKNQGEGLEIARKYPDIDFHFVGNQAGNFADYWSPLMKDVPDNVKIWGERDDVDTFMTAADIFMFNSTWECNPLVLREAIGYGLPVVARNLPQYMDMFTNYLLPIDTDLELIDYSSYNRKMYDLPKNTFTKDYIEFYDLTTKLSIRKQRVAIFQNFVDNPFLEIKGNSDADFKIAFFDEQGICHYANTVKCNSWVKLNRQYYTKWTAKVWKDDALLYSNTLNLTDKSVYIVIDSKSLGDTLAWIPYCLEFQKKHNCKVIVSSFWNKILDYPELELVEPGVTVGCYALYRIGWKWDTDKEPELCNTIPLQKTASNILGLEYKEIKPSLKHEYVKRVPDQYPYVAIATNSTMECKFWTREGWQEVINWLTGLGYQVVNVSKEDNPFANCIKIADTSIENTMDVIAGAKLFIGLSSGLSWLAWALNQKIVMISNFTEAGHEFDCYRVIKLDVCNGCWNDPTIKLDPYWNWCPRNKDFECQRSIPASMVMDKIKEAGI